MSKNQKLSHWSLQSKGVSRIADITIPEAQSKEHNHLKYSESFPKCLSFIKFKVLSLEPTIKRYKEWPYTYSYFFRKSKLPTLFLQFAGYFSQTVPAGITHSPSLWKGAYWIPRICRVSEIPGPWSASVCLFLHPLNSNHCLSPTASPLWALVEPILLFHVHSCSLGPGHRHLPPALVHRPLTLILPVQPSQKLSLIISLLSKILFHDFLNALQKKALIPWHDLADPSGSTSYLQCMCSHPLLPPSAP